MRESLFKYTLRGHRLLVLIRVLRAPSRGIASAAGESPGGETVLGP